MAAPLLDLEALGVRYLRRRSGAFPVTAATDPIHILNPDEQAALRRIERAVVLRAAAAGALSGAASALAEAWAARAFPGAAGTAWAWVIAVTVLATSLEIGFLYWDALRSVHELAHAAGVRLFPPDVSERLGTASALARAALELPNRPDPRLRLNPHREASRLVLLGAALVYKVKIGVTNFLLKLIFRRLAGRSVLRSWAPFMAVPVTAGWNAWVAYRVIREARIRAMGPSAARARVEALLDGRPPLSAEGGVAALRAVGYAVVGKRDLHPNLAVLIELVSERVGDCEGSLDDRAAFLSQLRTLPEPERDVALALLAAALVLDGRVSWRERRLWRAACRAASRPEHLRDLRSLRRAFVAGRPLE